MQGAIEIIRRFQGIADDEAMVRLVAEKLATTARELLEHDKVLQPIAVVLSADVSILFKVTHENTEAKKSAYAKLRKFAQLKRAHAVIAVGDGTIQTHADKTDAILVVIRAKSKSYSTVIPYYRHEVSKDQELVLFMEAYDVQDGKMPIIEAWW